MSAEDARRLQRAEGYLELELPREALQSLEEVSEEGKKEIVWRQLLGEAYRGLGQFEAAAKEFESVRLVRPENVSVLLALGWCYKRCDQLPKAIAALQSALQILKGGKESESRALVMYNLSCYYSLAGEKSKMLYWLEQAISLDDKYRESVAEESDFDPFRNDADLKKIQAI